MSDWVPIADFATMIEVAFPSAPSAFAAAQRAMSDGRIAVRGSIIKAKRRLDYVPMLNPGQNFPSLLGDEADQDTREVRLADVRKWIADLTGVGDAVPSQEPAKGASSRSLADQDADIVARMRERVSSGLSPSASDAALYFIEEAAGAGSLESKQRRLQRRYAKVYGVT